MVTIKKAILRSFDAESYTATIEISGSARTYLDGVPVAYNLPLIEMSAGRKLAVLFFDEHNVKDAVIVAVYM
jgi:hypothetical protein